MKTNGQGVKCPKCHTRNVGVRVIMPDKKKIIEYDCVACDIQWTKKWYKGFTLPKG